LRVLVTGATGRIGRAVTRRLHADGHAVRALVLPGDSGAGGLPDRIEVTRGDLRSPESLHRAACGLEAVVHLAALTAPGLGQPREYFASIAEGTFNLLEAVAGAEAALHRFVLASSVAVYFAAPDHPPLYAPVDELHPPRPATPYGAAKLAAEALLFARWRATGLPAVALRLSQTLEPAELAASQGVFAREHYLPAALEWLTRPGHPATPSESLFVAELQQHADHGDAMLLQLDAEGRSPLMDLTHPDDVARAVAAALEAPAAVGGVFNLGPPAPHSQARLADLLARRLGRPTAVVEPLGGTARSWTVSIAEARAALGYRPQHDAASMVEAAGRES